MVLQSQEQWTLNSVTTPDLDEVLNHITEQLPLSCFSAVNLNAF